MEKPFKISILTPEKTLYRGEIVSLIAPAALGYLGVLANHAPLMTTLTPGKITIRENSGNIIKIFSKGKGFLEVLKNNVTLLLDEG